MTIPIGGNHFITCTKNGVEFEYGPSLGGSPTSHRDLTMHINLSTFFGSTLYSGAHAAFAFDTSGVNAHSFPITRHGERLYCFGRGFAFFPDGRIYFERWGVAPTTECMAVVTRPAATTWEMIRPAGTVYSRFRLRVILGMDGSMQYNIDGYAAGSDTPIFLLWGEQTAASGKATLPSYTGTFAAGFINGFDDGSTAPCPKPWVEPVNTTSAGKEISVWVSSYTQV